MAEFCVDCWCKEFGEKERKKLIITRRAELCEECGQYKRVIIRYKLRYILADRFTELVENLQYLRKQ